MSLKMEDAGLLSDFPKIHCPFIRQTFAVNREQWNDLVQGAPAVPVLHQAGLQAMFDWYYSDRIVIPGYDTKGRPEVEDQERFD